MDTLRKKIGRKSKTADGARFADSNAYGHDVSDQKQRAPFQQELSSLATPHMKRQAPQVQRPSAQTDWFTAAMQNSAQLAAMADEVPQHQAHQEARQTKSSADNSKKGAHQVQTTSKHVRQPEPVLKDDSWFKEAMLQSSQLERL